MSETAAYLRRSLALLEWIGTSHPEAKVTLGSAELGCWGDMAPRWRLDGCRIRLQMRMPKQSLVFWISSVQAAPWGAAIKVWNSHKPCEEFQIIWQQPDAVPRPNRAHTLASARTWVRSILPGCRIVAAGHAPDRAHTISGNYLRLRMKQGDADHILLACAEGCDEEQAPAVLTQALLWLAYLRDKIRLSGAPTLHLLVPEGHAAVLFHRAQLINPDRAKVEVWEYHEGASGQWEARRPNPPAAPVEGRDFRWPVLGPFRWSPLLARVVDLAPDAIQRYPRFHDYDSLRLWGLEFARALGPERDRICYGMCSPQVELTEDNFEDLRALVNEIVYYRRADSPRTDHPYYRMQAERWLECLLLKNIAFLFPELIPSSVYPQIPVYLGKVPGRVDILGADREGNLVVMELKVSEDPDMPLQSIDYWGRVIGHNLSGDFERRGYFAELRLNRKPPKIYLVSPIFTFHDSLERVLRSLDPNLEVSKVAINEDWRSGVRILRRIAFKCGELA